MPTWDMYEYNDPLNADVSFQQLAKKFEEDNHIVFSFSKEFVFFCKTGNPLM